MAKQAGSNSLRLSGGVFTLTVLRLQSLDPDQLEQQWQEQSAALGILQGAPVVIDLADCKEQEISQELAKIIQILRRHGCTPVGMRNATPAQLAAADQLGLAQLRGMESPSPSTEKNHERPEPIPASPPLEHPLRSGQRHYARGQDLICLATVNAGAEVLADGHIHIYGPLRGRALAGVQGDETAQIFCQRLEAELIAIAGIYQTLDPQHPLWGRAARIFLVGEQMAIMPLEN